MSQSSPFGHPVQEDPTGAVPSVPVKENPPVKKTRIGLLAVAGAGVVAGAAVIGFLLMSGTSDDGLGFTGPMAQAPRATAAASPSPSPTPLPTESTVNARNPFLAPPTPSSTAKAGSTAGGQTVQTTNPATQPTTAPTTAPTTTPTTPPVLVTLVGFDSTSFEAKFSVKSPTEKGKTVYPVVPGDDFGKPLSAGSTKPFLYNGVVMLVNGKACPSVKFVDAPPVQVCKGDPVPVQ